MQHYQMLVTPG